jgi:indole-3-glycerol phosphate synthase
MSDRSLSHAIADGEGISLIAVAADGRLAAGADPAAVARVADLAGAEASATADVELAVRVRDEDELERALEELDPELLVLAGTLEQVLDLLPDVPAGKLVIAEVPGPTEEDVDELERAGVDAVIVP